MHLSHLENSDVRRHISIAEMGEFQSSKALDLLLSALGFYSCVDRSDTAPEVCPCTPIVVSTSHEPSISYHLRKLGLTRKLAYGLDQVLIRVPVASQDRAQEGNHAEGVLVVQSVMKVDKK